MDRLSPLPPAPLQFRAAATSHPLRVGLVERDELIRRGLHAMAARHPSHLLLLDPPSGGPLDILLADPSQLRQPAPVHLAALRAGTRARYVVALTWLADPRSIREAVAMEADGYLSKGLSGEQFVAALIRIARGERVLQLAGHAPDAAEAERRAAWSGDPTAREGLTPRQVQLMELVALGLSNDEIGARLFLSKNTVKSYVRAVYRRIGVNTRSQAVRWSIEHGFGRAAASELLAG